MKQVERNYTRSVAMVLDFDEIVPEDRAGGDEGVGQRRSQFYVFLLRTLGYHGRLLKVRRE